jgi:hypothetical protein
LFRGRAEMEVASRINAHGSGKLARVIRYGAVALIAAWSLLALAGYAVVGTVAGWMTSVHATAGMVSGGEAAGEWIAWSGELVGQAGGPAIGIVWLTGTLLILGASAVIRRFAA